MLTMEPSLMSLEKKKYGVLNESLGTYYFLTDDFKEAVKYFREAIRYDPINPHYLFKWLLCNSIRGLPGNWHYRLYGLAKTLWHLIEDLKSR